MKKGKKLYEGKAKIIYSTSDKNLVIQYFKDDATAFNILNAVASSLKYWITKFLSEVE